MINYYQPYLLPFLKRQPYRLSPRLKRFYYHSWEDGLWDLLQNKAIPKGLVVLIPDFYCIDVVENIQSHGYTTAFYPLDDHFQIQETELIKYIKQYQPAIILIFHACGITSKLLQQKVWLTFLPQSSLIIEDCVHRLVDPKDITLIDHRHIVMDSLRKDSPLPGSFMYGSVKQLNFQQSPTIISWYLISSSLLYLLFRITLLFSFIFSLPRLTSYAHTKLLKAHDDIIGDSVVAHQGLPWNAWLHRFIDFQKIKQVKERQSKIYNQLTQELIQESPLFYSIHIPTEDYPHLHVYPLGIRLPADQCQQIERALQKKGIVVWCKFPDAPWSQQRAVLFLPLGFHMKDLDILKIFDALKKV